MSTSTVLRVKRRLEDNPQDALVLMCKRAKTEVDELSPSLFVFRGTVKSQETSQVKNVVPNNDMKLKATHSVNDIIEKIRKEKKDKTTQNRYEVINLSRGLKDDCGDDDDDQFHLVDLQKKVEDEEANVQYAYDLYTAPKQDFDISMLDRLVSIEDYETDLIFGSYRDNGRETPSGDEVDDDDDSNDENNWRNEYPDSDPSSIDEEDMVQAIAKVDIADDLSSDAGEDNIYSEPPDLCNEDVKKYGAAYAKYKAKVLAEQPDLSDSRNFVHCVSVKEVDGDSDGYKEDSDDGFYYGQDEDSEQFREQYADEGDGSEESSPD